MNWIKRILRLGIYDGQSLDEIKRVRLLNLICFSWYIVIIFFLITDYFTLAFDEYINVSITHCTQFFVVLIVQFLQKKRKYTAARILLILSFFIQCAILCNLVLIGRNIEYWFIIPPLLSLLFLKESWYHYSALFLSFIGFLLPLVTVEDAKIDVTTTSILFIAIFLNVKYFKTSNINAEKTLQNQKERALKDKALIEDQKTQLQKLNDFQNQFFVNVAHEIRTPLTILKGNTYKLERSIIEPSVDQESTLEVLKKQSSKIQRIVDDILDLTRMESDSFELRKEQIQLSEFVAKNFLAFSSNFEGKQIAYHLKDLTTGQSVMLEADPTYLERAFNNLLSNALKYTRGGGAVTVTICLSAGHVVLAVEDTGLGINGEDLAKIFDRFYQAENSINRSGGSGIGLSYTREVVLMHGGEITVKSELGVGSVFSVTLPVALVSDSELETVDISMEIEEKNKQTEANKGKLKVLLVEDQADMRQYIKEVLSPYEVLEAENGLVALEILSRETVSFIVTDYMMPNMDGHELVKELKGRQIHTPILLLTARSDQDAKMRMLRLGVDDYLTKPFEEEELLVRIENGLKRHTNWQQFLKNEQVSKEESAKSGFILNLEQYICDHCQQSYFGIAEISNHFALSVSSLFRKVKSMTGMSPKAFITEVRLQKAREILESRKATSIKGLAADVGFSNYSYFQNLYRERFGTDLSQLFSY